MRTPLFPSRIGAPGSQNVYMRNGRITPAFPHFILADADRGNYPRHPVETVAPLTSGGQPRQYCAAGRNVLRLDNGDVTDDTTATTLSDAASEFGNPVTGMVISHDPTGTDVAATKPILIAGFGASTTPRLAYRDLTADGAGVWTVQTSSVYAQFWDIVRVGADHYAVTDAGVTVLGEWRVSRCPAGNNPLRAANWGNGIEVGESNWSVTQLAPLAGSHVAAKPDGLYYWDGQLRRYWNVLAHFELVPHPGNGRGLTAVTGGVIYPTQDGHVYFFDGTSVQEITPEKYWGQIPRDAGFTRYTAAADNGDVVALARDVWQNTTANAGLKVVKVDGGVATDLTVNTTDGDFSTGGAVGGLGAGGTDHLYIGADVPFEAVKLWVTRKPNENAEAWDTPEYSDGSGFTAFTSIVDGTKLDPGESLDFISFPPADSGGLITWPDINAYDAMKSQAVAFGGSVGNVTKYWIRLPVGTTGFSADAEIDEVEIVPSRAGLPLAAANDFTHRDNAGGVTHIVLGRRTGTTGFTWFDSYAVHSLSGVYGMAYHNGRLGQSSGQENLGPALVCWSRQRVIAISQSHSGDPNRTRFPRLATFTATRPGPVLQFAHRFDGGKPEKLKVISGIWFNTEYVQNEDVITVYGQYDDRAPVVLGRLRGGPGWIAVPEVAFRFANLWASFEDSAVTDPAAPAIIEPIIVEWTVVDGDAPRDANTPIPEVV